MEGNSRSISVDEEIKVSKLKVKAGTMLYDGRIILIYESLQQKDDEPKQKKLKSTEVGIVKKILVKEGDIVAPGSVIVELEKKCSHPTVIKDLCAECGADLQKENAKEGGPVSTASVSMVHMIPELKVDQEHAQILGKADMDRLLEHKKLVLLVDLDQTLIHTTNDNIPNNIKDVYHFQLYGPQSAWYHTRLRPGTHNFLQGISEKYELHICTFGSRRYAHTITRFLDPDGKLFSHRILSRDECFDPNSKTANLRALFPCGEKMVCIIDDREDVWEYASNLIHVKPYHFFQHTGDIHAPPGLTKCENDDKQGYDFSHLGENQNDDTSKHDDNEEIVELEENKKENTDEEGVKNADHTGDRDVNQNGESVVDEKSSGGGDEETNVKIELEETPNTDANEVNSKSDETTNVKMELDETPISDVIVSDENSKKLETADVKIELDETPITDVVANDENLKPDETAEAKMELDETPIADVIVGDENFKKLETADVKIELDETPITNVVANDENSKPDETTNAKMELDEAPIADVGNDVNSKPDETLVTDNEDSKRDDATSIEAVSVINEDPKVDETPVSEVVLENTKDSKPDEISVPEVAIKSNEDSKPLEAPVCEIPLQDDEDLKPEKILVENIPSTKPYAETMSSEEKPNDSEYSVLLPEKDETDTPDLTLKPPEPTQESVKLLESGSESPKPPIEEGHPATNNVSKPLMDENGFVTIEETDDYLLYLEEILKNIHSEFFKRLGATKIIPDLKALIPETRAKVLEGVSIVFSGIIPNRVKLEDSQAYKIARSLGAKVTQNIENTTTHLVALRCGTAKVHAAYRRRNLKLVTPDWLWTCAERWEKVDERMFPLRNAVPNTESRNPPAHCRSPEHPEPLPYQITNNVNSNQVAGFMYSFNPLMSLSSEDIESMAGEVEDMFKESDGEADGADETFRSVDDDDTNDAIQVNVGRKRKLENESSSSSEEEDESRFEKFSKIRKRKRCKQVEDEYDINKTIENEDDEEDDEDEKEGEDSDDDDTINTRFRRGEKLPSDLDIDYNTEDGTEEERESDGEWNVMGAALEREFLEGE